MKNILNLSFFIFAALVLAHEPALAASGLQSLSTVGNSIVDELTAAVKWIGTGGLLLPALCICPANLAGTYSRNRYLV